VQPELLAAVQMQRAAELKSKGSPKARRQQAASAQERVAPASQVERPQVVQQQLPARPVAPPPVLAAARPAEQAARKQERQELRKLVLAQVLELLRQEEPRR
jgi:hypothetical protein